MRTEYQVMDSIEPGSAPWPLGPVWDNYEDAKRHADFYAEPERIYIASRQVSDWKRVDAAP